MLAKRRALKLTGEEIARTPLLVPSFSSKGFPEIAKIIETTEEVIEGAILISAYDLHYAKIKPPFDFARPIFLDSGGTRFPRINAKLATYLHQESISTSSHVVGSWTAMIWLLP